MMKIAALLMATGLAFSAMAVQAQDAAASAVVRPAVITGELVYGSKDAPVEMIEYGSLTCPHCAEFAVDVFPRLKAEFIDTGRVRFIFRNYIRDRYDMAATQASRCTADADIAKALTEDLFAEQDTWLRAKNPYEKIAEIVAKRGVDQKAFGACLLDDSFEKDLADMRLQGSKLYKITKVPTLVVNGMPTAGHSYEDLKKLIEAAP